MAHIGSVRSLIEGPLLRGEDRLLVKDVMVNGSWGLGDLSFDFNSLIQSGILAILLWRISVKGDKQSWISSLNKGFDSKNAYLLAIGENPDNPNFMVSGYGN